ncbi:MAG: hypothetical protein U5K29_14905 [Acidimicrobiales bacterium]|nr:hypothetical protein [Acidimicrobiales bacterium]
MSEIVIFTVGVVVFGLTVWGAVMAGSLWMAGLDEDVPSTIEEMGRRSDAPRAEPEADGE